MKKCTYYSIKKKNILSYYNEHGTMILYDNYQIVSRKTLISKFGVESIIAFYGRKK
jgi:hypothetical protein